MTIISFSAKLVDNAQKPVMIGFSISPLAKWTTFSAINATSDMVAGYKSLIFPFHNQMDMLVSACRNP